MFFKDLHIEWWKMSVWYLYDEFLDLYIIYIYVYTCAKHMPTYARSKRINQRKKNTSVQDVVPKLGEILATMKNGRSGDQSGYPRSRASVAETNGTPRKSTARKWDDTAAWARSPALLKQPASWQHEHHWYLKDSKILGQLFKHYLKFKYNVYKYKISFPLTRFMWIYNLRSKGFTRSPPWTPSCSCWALGAAGEAKQEREKRENLCGVGEGDVFQDDIGYIGGG